jgi:hypothetical protein
MAMSKLRGQAPKANVGGKRSLKYGGVSSAGNRFPLLNAPEGSAYSYRVRVQKCYNSNNGTSDFYHADLEVVASDSPEFPEGTTGSYLQCTSGKAEATGIPRVKTFTRAAMGCKTDPEFDEKCEEVAREFVEEESAVDMAFYFESIGEFPELTEAGHTVVGRLVDVTVTRGKMMADGSDYYRNYSWEPVSEEEQEA